MTDCVTNPGDGAVRTRRTAIKLARTFAPALSALRKPLAAATAGMLLPILPLAHFAYRGFAGLMPEGDKRVFANPDIEAMFVDDILLVSRGRFQALIDDARVFARDWGFRLADVKVPVRWWHGDADPIVTFEDAKTAASRLPDAELILMPDESHLGGFAAAGDVLSFIRSHL